MNVADALESRSYAEGETIIEQVRKSNKLMLLHTPSSSLSNWILLHESILEDVNVVFLR